MAYKFLNKRSSTVLDDGTPKLPTADQLEYGEIAINYGAGVETLSIKNSDGEIVDVYINGLMQTIAESLAMHEARTDNPHGVTKDDVGLGNVDNTSDTDKPVSTEQKTALDLKLDTDDVVDNLTTSSSTKALSAAQGVALQELINNMTSGSQSDLSSLISRVTAIEEEIEKANEFATGDLLTLAKEIHEELTI